MHFPLAMPLQLLTGVAGVALLGGIVHALLTGRLRRARLAATLAVAWAVLYLGAVLAFSVSSTEQVLGLNQPKRFCGFYLDCHAMVSLVDVARSRTLGAGAQAATAAGLYYVVTLRQSSDGKRVPIGIADPVATVIDADGIRYDRSSAAEAALAAIEGPQPGLGHAVQAGSGYTTKLVFDLPRDVSDPRLHVAEGGWLARLSELFLIGDEDSMLHKRSVFRLPAG